MQCRKCQKDMDSAMPFCPWCGAKQAVDVRKPRKRGNGQGSAIKRGNSWVAVYTSEFYATPDGKLHQRRKWKGGFKTKKEALAFASSPVETNEKAPTLRDYWNNWFASDFSDLSKSKQTAFKIAWKKMERLAGKSMDVLTIQDLQTIIDEKAPTYYPAKDIKTLFSHLFKRAVAEGQARTNLSEFIRLPSLDEKEQEPFSEVELRRFWDAYGSGDHFIGFVLLMIYTGMMPGELLGLKKDMIDFEKNEIHKAGIKTKKRKSVPIVFPDMIAPIIADLIERSNSTHGYVVGMNKDKFYSEYHSAMVRTGVRDLPPYSCRHTTATALALGNIAPSVIQKVMRHTKFSTTQRYIHPDTTSVHKAVNTMGRGKISTDTNSQHETHS